MQIFLPAGTTTMWLALREQCALAKTLTLVAMVPPSPPAGGGPVVIALASLVPPNDPRIQIYTGPQGAEVYFTADPNDGTIMYKAQSGRVAMAVPLTVYESAQYLIRMDWRPGTTDVGGPFSSSTDSTCRAGSMIAAHTDSWCAPPRAPASPLAPASHRVPPRAALSSPRVLCGGQVPLHRRPAERAGQPGVGGRLEHVHHVQRAALGPGDGAVPAGRHDDGMAGAAGACLLYTSPSPRDS